MVIWGFCVVAWWRPTPPRALTLALSRPTGEGTHVVVLRGAVVIWGFCVVAWWGPAPPWALTLALSRPTGEGTVTLACLRPEKNLKPLQRSPPPARRERVRVRARGMVGLRAFHRVNSSEIAPSTPSMFSRTSGFQNRITRNPLASQPSRSNAIIGS